MLLAAEQGWVAEVPGPEEPRERGKKEEKEAHREFFPMQRLTFTE